MDRRYGEDQDEKVELNTYRGYHSNNSFEHPEPFTPSGISSRPLTPVRPGHFPTDEYGQPVWLQPTARMSGHSDSFHNSSWDSRTPYDSRSASPTLVSTILVFFFFFFVILFVLLVLGIDHSLMSFSYTVPKPWRTRKSPESCSLSELTCCSSI
jgi:hypothetical protein